MLSAAGSVSVARQLTLKTAADASVHGYAAAAGFG
jgi:hypothetical protein